MPTFLYLYRGAAPAGLTPDQGAERMAAFGAWMARLGPALLDAGSPVAAGSSVRDDGARDAPIELTGYSFVEAADLAAAEALTDGLPFLADRDGRHAVDIYELRQM